jgi:hypothetical protein
MVEIDDGVQAATQWLLSKLGDGLPDDVVPHTYRVPFALTLVGRRGDAARVMSWLEREVLDADGDLRPGPMRTAFSARWSSYPLAILAQAAWHLERFGTAASIVRTLARFQDPAYGGAYAERPELRTTGRQDLFPTAQLGITGLTVGDDALADGAFHWLATLFDLQPDLPSRLFTATDGARLITDPDEVAADRFGLCTDFRAPRQAFYNPGIAAAFLARYSARWNSPAARQLADAYLALTVGGGDVQFDHTDSVQVCKFAWGAAALLDLDPQPHYREHVERMARWFLDAQHADGHWQNSPFLLPDGPTTGSSIEVTAEFIQHLVVVATALAGAGRDG